MQSGRKIWAIVKVAVVVSVAAAALTLPPGRATTAIGDYVPWILLVIATCVMTVNAVSERGTTRRFWTLMAFGCFLWTINQTGWLYYEIWVKRALPDPFFGDVILFLHVVPFMAAMALRPHRTTQEQKLRFNNLNFLMLAIWWMFLYAFVVFPDEWVVLNVPVYSHSFDVLYLLENVVLLGVLGFLAASTKGAWKKIYWNFFLAIGMYTWSSEAINAALTRGVYYTGSLYDVPFTASVCWFIGAALLARETKPTSTPVGPQRQLWTTVAPRLAMLAILSLPLLGFWAAFWGPSLPVLRNFRLLVTFAAVLVLGGFVFVRQYLLDRDLVRLLDESRQGLENLRRLQTQLVQKEKLASLGQLVAGAAHEINNPLAAILGYSELLVGNQSLGPDQISMAYKICQQARRTRDLVSGLLSFAQQAPGEKALVDIGSLMHRAVQMEMLRLESKKIRVETSVAPHLPKIWGNANQLFQCCLQIVVNAMDALEDVGGGTLHASARQEGDSVVMEFLDSGPGMREPQRVFDPFYTTKPLGKGTGLGLSATYGVVQDHHGQIACQNQPEGGALFRITFPVATQKPSAHDGRQEHREISLALPPLSN